jgi:hypothetical protein
VTTYITSNGDRIHAETSEDIVGELHGMSHTPATDDEAFMKEMSSRIKFMDNQIVRCDTTENFVADLLGIGFLKIDAEGGKEEDEKGSE